MIDRTGARVETGGVAASRSTAALAAKRARAVVEAARRVVATAGDAREEAIGALRAELERLCAPACPPWPCRHVFLRGQCVRCDAERCGARRSHMDALCAQARPCRYHGTPRGGTP